MNVKTLEKRFEKHTDKQFVNYVKSHWCKNRKQPLLDMLEDLEIQFDSKESMDKLIIKHRKEIADYILECYYNA